MRLQTPTPTHQEEDSRRGASRGQVIVMFALFSTAMIGVLGLATDLGFAYAQRRTMQNAADAGAMAGARAVAKWSAASPGTSASADVTTIAQSNQMGSATVTVTSCTYVTYANANAGNCASAVPSTATGVKVDVEEEHETFFIQVLPGAPDTVTTRATATAHVQKYSGEWSNGPFIICGPKAWDVTSNPTLKNGGTNLAILSSQSPVTINPAAINRIFRVHDPKLDSEGKADCKSKAGRFKGLADQDRNAGRTAAGWFGYDTGTKAGPTRTKVYGIEGCNPNTDEPYNCVMMLPIATDNPNEPGNTKEVYVIGFAAFRVTTVDKNSHNAQLLDDYIVSGPGTSDWCRDCGGTVVVRLTA